MRAGPVSLPVASPEQIAAGRALVDGIRLDEDLIRYILEPGTRDPVGSRRSRMVPRPVRRMRWPGRCARQRRWTDATMRSRMTSNGSSRPAMRHRIVLGPTAEIEGRTPDQVLENMLNQIEAPR